MAKRKKSEVWPYFTEEPATALAICKLCETKVRRGKDNDRPSWSVTPLWAHLRRHHPEEHRKAEEEREKGASVAKKRKDDKERREQLYVHGTPRLADYVTRKQKYLPNSKEQTDLTSLLSEWIADGILPYGIVDNKRLVFFFYHSLLD